MLERRCCVPGSLGLRDSVGEPHEGNVGNNSRVRERDGGTVSEYLSVDLRRSEVGWGRWRAGLVGG